MINSRHDHLIRPELINNPALQAFLDRYVHCEICDTQTMIDTGKRCPECIYYKGSLKSKKRGIYRIAFRPSIAKKFGFLTEDHIGRTDIVYFRRHPELNNEMPIIPDVDIFGVATTPFTHWQKHHWKTHYNDRYVVRLLSSEHPTIEAMARRGDFTLLYHLLETREVHPNLEPGVLMTRAQVDEFYKGFKKVNGIYVKTKKYKPIIIP